MKSTPRVLVIDELSDTELVLKAVLEPRGTTVSRNRETALPGHHNRSCSSLVSHALMDELDDVDVDSTSETTIASRQPAPDVVVIDLDNHPEAMFNTRRWTSSSCILIGSYQPQVVNAQDRFLAKPFQYPELVRTIEGLLSDREVA